MPRADDVIDVDLEQINALLPLQQTDVARQLGFANLDLLARAEWEGL